MLEWYRPGADMDSLIDETTAYLRAVLPPVVTCRGVTTDLSRVERLTVAEAFARYVGADVLATAEDAPALAAAAGTRLRDERDLGGPVLPPAARAGRTAAGAARIRRSSPIGPPRRPHWRAAIRPIRASPRGSSCSSAASNWPTPSSSSPTPTNSARASRPIARGATRRPDRTGRSTRTSSRPSPSACRHLPESLSASTGWR